MSRPEFFPPITFFDHAREEFEASIATIDTSLPLTLTNPEIEHINHSLARIAARAIQPGRLILASASNHQLVPAPTPDSHICSFAYGQFRGPFIKLNAGIYMKHDSAEQEFGLLAVYASTMPLPKSDRTIDFVVRTPIDGHAIITDVNPVILN